MKSQRCHGALTELANHQRGCVPMMTRQGRYPATLNRVFVRSVMNFVTGDEWFCSIFKLKMGDSPKMVRTLQNALG